VGEVVLPFGKGIPLFEKEEIPPLKKGDAGDLFPLLQRGI